MGPFEFKNVINEIQIRQGKWGGISGQISETELPKKTVTLQTSETEPTKESTETEENIIEKDSVTEKSKISAISGITVLFTGLLGVLLVIVLVLLFHGKTSQ